METIYLILASAVCVICALMALLICMAAWELKKYDDGRHGESAS